MLMKTEIILKCLSVLDRDMAARHRARATVIQILKVEVIPASKCRRPHMKQLFVSPNFVGNSISFIQITKYTGFVRSKYQLCQESWSGGS